MGKKEKEVKVVEEVKSYSSIDIHIEKLQKQIAKLKAKK